MSPERNGPTRLVHAPDPLRFRFEREQFELGLVPARARIATAGHGARSRSCAARQKRRSPCGLGNALGTSETRGLRSACERSYGGRDEVRSDSGGAGPRSCVDRGSVARRTRDELRRTPTASRLTQSARSGLPQISRARGAELARIRARLFGIHPAPAEGPRRFPREEIQAWIRRTSTGKSTLQPPR
mgnify:FL=1